MNNKFWVGAGVLAAVVAGIGTANAADISIRPLSVYKPAAPAYLAEWSGFYLGVNGGWGEGAVDASVSNKIRPKGDVIGGHAGYNWQYGSVVGGLEADYDNANMNRDVRISGAAGTVGLGNLKTDQLATVRGRLGYTVVPSALFYVTAGGAWGHTKVVGLGSEAGQSQTGWAAGAGVEYKVWGGLLARVEYLHYDFGNQTINNGPIDVNVKESVDTVRGGLSYKF